LALQELRADLPNAQVVSSHNINVDIDRLNVLINAGPPGANPTNAYEGVACFVFPNQAAGTVPLHRLFNPTSGDHFYTTDDKERNNAAGYNSEGDACFVFPNQAAGTVRFHRLFNRRSGDHFYTTSDSERDNVTNLHDSIDSLHRHDSAALAPFAAAFGAFYDGGYLIGIAEGQASGPFSDQARAIARDKLLSADIRMFHDVNLATLGFDKTLLATAIHGIDAGLDKATLYNTIKNMRLEYSNDAAGAPVP